MSIPAAAAAANPFLTEAIVAAVCLGLAVPLVLRMLRRGPLDLPERLPPGASAWPLAVALVWGLIVWVTVPTAYLSSRQAGGGTTAPATTQAVEAMTGPAAPDVVAPPSPPERPSRVDLSRLPPRDVAFVAVVPGVAVLLALVGLDLLTFGGNLRGLGFGLRQSVAGLGAGAKMSLVFVPLVFGAAVLAEWAYRAVGYEHPTEHDLLRVLGRAGDPLVRIGLTLGAVVVAPLSEELLFRGHAQTILRRCFTWLARGRTSEPDRNLAVAPPRWATWGAIAVASGLFAVVHAPWTWPPIFLLSMCLGWAYERTNNLWAPVAIHAVFNAVSTTLFLAGAGGGGGEAGWWGDVSSWLGNGWGIVGQWPVN